MTKYAVKFQKGKKIHTVKVTAQGIIPAIEQAVMVHYTKYYNDALTYEIIGAEKID